MKYLWLNIILLLFSYNLATSQTCSQPTAQPSYPLFKMKDTTVVECKGIFTDSELNTINAGWYKENEKSCFKIVFNGTINLDFSCLDLGLGDTLFFYQGYVNCNNPGVAPFIIKTNAHNTTTFNIVRNSPASDTLVIRFKSNNIVNASGWIAKWRVTPLPPVPPTISINPLPNCSTTTIYMNLSKKVHCDSVYTNAFAITAPPGVTAPVISSAVGQGCPSLDDSTNVAVISLAGNGIVSNCTYQIDFTINLLDFCDSMWTFTEDTTFTVTDCPIPVTFTTNPPNTDTICPGMSIDITANSTSSSCLALNWNWNNGLGTGPGPKTVSPLTTTTYCVNVDAGGPSFQSCKTIYVINPQILIGDTTICQSEPAFSIPVNIGGGIYTGNGMLQAVGSIGTFDPDTAGGGVHIITYGIGTLCKDTIRITVIPIDAGPDEAACPNSPPFVLSGFLPAVGGYWKGPFVDSASGTFTPPATPGVYIDTFYANGCMDTKTIYVGNLGVSNTIDSVCQNIDPYYLSAQPPGGTFSGPGIQTVDSLFDPDDAGGGLHHILYTINGCQDTIKIYVKAMDAGGNRTACPSQTNLYLYNSSSGGTWSSTNPNTGLLPPGTHPAFYDASILGHGGNDTLTYTMPNGCTDTSIVYIRTTNIYEEIRYYCIDEDSVDLTSSQTQGGVNKNPCCSGSWTTAAPGAIAYFGNPDYKHYFYPSIAGPGTHWLYWTKNTCVDSMRFIVYPDLKLRDTTLCSAANPLQLGNMPDSTVWFGNGVNPTTGLFTPLVAGPGTHNVGYITPAGCGDTAQITIYQFQAASINGLTSPYCHKDTNYSFSYSPNNSSIWFGPGTDTTTMTFNPVDAGAGYDTIIVSYGIGECTTTDTMIIEIYPELTTTYSVTEDTICGGGYSVITINPSGGNPLATYNHTWTPTLPSRNTNQVSPPSTTTYVIVTSDGCSTPVYDTITIYIFPGFTVGYTTSDTLCYGNEGYVLATPNPAGPYSYAWGPGVPNQDSIAAPVGTSYNVKVTNTQTGCHKDTIVRIPMYSIVKALFSLNPDEDCVPYDQRFVDLIDLSQNGLTGTWEIDGVASPYQPGINPSQEFKKPGTHSIKLTVYNEGNCVDSYELTLCIQEDTTIFIPDVFSPNGDNINDILYARAGAYKEFNFFVYNRFGQKVFETTDSKMGWDGTINGKPAPQDVYVYYVSSLTVHDVLITKKGDVTLVR